jgi:RHS repeat-associated protein
VIGTEGGTTTVYIGNYFEWKGSTSTMVRYYYAGAERVAMRTGAADPLWLLGDHLGSTSVVANYDGTIYINGGRLARQGYKAWGEQRFPDPLNSSPLPTTFRYTGQRESETFGLYWYGSRWYDSSLGRFTSPDTIIPLASQGVQAWDRYAGMNNNPVRYNDPSGHCLILCTMIIGAAVGAIVGAVGYTAYTAATGTEFNTGHMLMAAGAGAIAGAVIGSGIGLLAAAETAATTAAVAETANTACGGDMCAGEAQEAIQNVEEAAPTLESAVQGARQFWTNTTNFQGNTVYQNPGLVNPDLTQNGITNVQRMQEGLAPIGPDGFPLQLHHMLQTNEGPIAEVTRTFHQTYSSILHINPNTIGSAINRAAFNSWRIDYWMYRAEEFLEK